MHFPNHAVLACASVFALAAADRAAAQHPAVCAGNGVGQAYLEHTQARIGSTVEIALGSPASPGGYGVLNASDGYGPTVVPVLGIGSVCLDAFSPGYFAELVLLDGTGRAALSLPIPGSASLSTLPPLYINALVVEGTGSQTVLSISHSSALYWHNLDSYQPVANTMAEARSMHTATSTHRFAGDSRIEVLITGGGGGNFMQPVATATTELYSPLDRTFRPGPPMANPRAGHRAVRLMDGRILITGGADAGNVGLTACEIYDPATNGFAPAASMSAPRMGHGCTLLPDGRVLVTGGFTTWVDAVTNFLGVLNSAQDSAEIYDPATDTWAALPAMASRRAGHGQILTPSGQVLIIAGINGGTFASVPIGQGPAIPTYTNRCQGFDPNSNSFYAAPSLNVTRAFFGVSLLGNEVVVTGGIVPGPNYGAAEAGVVCERLGGLAWQRVGDLPSTQAFHEQITTRSGLAVAIGGFTGNLVNLDGTAGAAAHDGSTAIALAGIGSEPATNPAGSVPIGNHTVTELHDGTWLVVGGSHALIARDDGWIYQPR